ncbi:TauD/TfdA dioxygenase family protein [Ramlibacter sp.]|uniref:TauD/TfdA dioxygenase family protein n=1 Tax=Ramlibacter sp. TaxID=1917967 RepID=UPI003D12EF16
MSATASSSTGRFAPLSPKFGVELTGVDLSRPIPTALAQQMCAAIEKHHLLVVRDQHLDADAQEAFSRCFGEVQEHVGRMRDGSRLAPVHEISNVDENDQPTDKPYLHATSYWHTDGAHFPTPPSFTVLHAVILPPDGGDTSFASMVRAYEALPTARQRDLEQLRAAHSYGEKNLNIGGPPGKEAEMRDAPPVLHPLVRKNPTGEKALYIGMYAVRIPGMPDEDARALLKDLLAHATQEQFVYTHQWRPGDVVMWDNRALLHRAVQNFDMRKHKRVMRRTVVKGTVTTGTFEKDAVAAA